MLLLLLTIAAGILATAISLGGALAIMKYEKQFGLPSLRAASSRNQQSNRITKVAGVRWLRRDFMIVGGHICPRSLQLGVSDSCLHIYCFHLLEPIKRQYETMEIQWSYVNVNATRSLSVSPFYLVTIEARGYIARLRVPRWMAKELASCRDAACMPEEARLVDREP